MTRNSLLLGLAGLLLLLLLATFGFSRAAVTGPAANGNQELTAAIDRITDNQTRLAERLDRLESRFASSDPASLPARALAPGGSPGAVAGINGNYGGMRAPADQDALAAKQRHDMEDRLISDPLSPQWAKANEKTIGNFLSRDNLAKQQLPAPKAFQAECHSHLCRISMTFADDAQASQTQAMLLMEIAPSLSGAQTFLLPQSDGSVQMLVYAGEPSYVH